MEVTTINTGSSGNCYIIKSGNGDSVILDAGVKFEKITHHPNFPKFKDISFVFVSHTHSDHNKSIKDFKRSGCEIVSYETLPPRLHKQEIGNWFIATFPVAHNVPCWGIALKHKITNETLCYITDFYKAPMMEGIDEFIFEINYIEAYIDELIEQDKTLNHTGFNNHCSLEYAIDYFTRMKTIPNKIYCCHGSSSHSIKKKIYEGMKQFADEVVVL